MFVNFKAAQVLPEATVLEKHRMFQVESGGMALETPVRRFVNLSLIGFMGVGKSSVGRMIASALHMHMVDTDDLIELRAGMPIPSIFASLGERGFRECEREVVLGLEGLRDSVISTGGGLAANADNLRSLRTHSLVVCLWAGPEVIWERVRHQSHRPLLQTQDPQERIRELLAQREPFYRQADVMVNTECRNLQEVAQHVIHHARLAGISTTI